MRVGVHLLKRIPMDFEPSDSVAFVRSKIQRLFLEQLRKQGEDDLDEVDVTLLFQGEVLEDSQTLAEANVTANATLFVLSQSLAEIHGKHSGVFSVRKAFEDLAQSGLSGADAEAQALKNAPPFSLFCNIQELGELGAGWVLFFHFVRFLGILCVVLFALQLPSYFVFRSFPEEALESWRNHSHTKRDHPISWDYITAGNTGPHGSDACWPWVCALVTALLMLFLLPQYARLQRQLRQQIDRRQVDPDDFALFLDGLPSDARDEDEIKEFIEKHGRPERTEVVMVVISYDMEVFQQMLHDIKEAKEEMAESGETPALEERLKELRRPFRSSEALRAALPCTGQAVVVLRSQEEHREVIEQWDNFFEWLMNLTQCLKINSRTTRFRKRHVVRITRAANPSDILWENLSASHQLRLWLRAKTYGFVAVTLIGCLLIVVSINWILDHFMGNKAERKGGGWGTFSSLLVAFVVMMIRIRASLTIRRQVMQQKHMTKTGRDVSLLAKLSLFYLTCYCVIAMLVNWEARFWYTAGNLVSDIASLMTFNCITIPLYILFSCKLLIRNFMRDQRLNLEKPPATLTQSQFQTFFELPDMDQTRPFAKVILTFVMGFIFMPIWPYAILIAAAALFLEYWAFKDISSPVPVVAVGAQYQLLRQSKRPYRQSVDVAYAALRILYMALAGYGFAQEILLTPSLSVDQGAWSSSISLPLLVLPLLLLTMSMRLQRLLCGGFLCSGSESTSTSVDYYAAQRFWAKHQKYHTTNLVYLRGFEMIDAAAKKLRYDPRTGNLPSPELPVPVSSTSGRLGGLTDAVDVETGESPGREDSEELEEEPEETEAIADEDPAALAMEEIKHKVPWHDEPDSGEDGESSEDDESSGEDSGDSDGEMPPLVLRAGALVRIRGLQKAGAEEFNGQTCTLLQPAADGKWICQLRDGRKAAMAPQHLQLKAKIVKLRSSQGKVYNSTICTLIRFDPKVEKWLVELFTGIEAHVAAENLLALTS